jgi:predicted dinucleotide-binding enzyme
MKIAVLGKGVVGRALNGRLSQLDHEVTVGTRDPAATLARTRGMEMYLALWLSRFGTLGTSEFNLKLVRA